MAASGKFHIIDKARISIITLWDYSAKGAVARIVWVVTNSMASLVNASWLWEKHVKKIW